MEQDNTRTAKSQKKDIAPGKVNKMAFNDEPKWDKFKSRYLKNWKNSESVNNIFDKVNEGLIILQYTKDKKFKCSDIKEMPN